MKKFLIFSLFFAFLFAGNINANQAVTSHEKKGSEVISMQKDHNFFKTIKTKVNAKVNNIKQKISNSINDIKTSLGGDLKTAVVLMVIGLIFLILAGALSWGGIVYAVGAIFFVIGALLLLLNFL